MAEKHCPPALIKYTLFSTLASIAILVLSILSYCTLALWANIAASTLALIFHSAILFFSWRRSMDDQSLVHRMHIAYSSKTLMASAVVLFVWLASLGSSIEQVVNQRTDRLLLPVKRGPGKMEMQITVTGLIFVEVIGLGAWLVHSLYIRPRRAVLIRQELEVTVERGVYSPSSLDLVQKERKKKSPYPTQTRYSTLLRHQSLFIAAKHEAPSDVLQPPPPVATKEEDRPWSFLTPMAPASPSSGTDSRYGILWD